jgi:hypothetical protein
MNKGSKKLWFKIVGLGALLVLMETLHAEWKLPDTFQVHGFLSQGLILTTENEFFGTSSRGGSLDFRELGINGSWRPLTNLQLSMQVVSRSAGETDDGIPRIDYGFLDYSFISDVEDLWGVRAGRVVTPLGFYNETRDMAFTRPSILLPQSIYFDINRNLALSGDGLHLYGERRAPFGDFFFQIGGIFPRTTDPDFNRIFTRNVFPGEMGGKPSWVGRLMYESSDNRLRLALSGGQFRAKFRPGAPPTYTHGAGSFEFSPLLLSAQYNAHNWSLTGEYARRHSRLRDFITPGFDDSFTGESYYIQGTYRLARNWEAILRYDVLYWNIEDRDGEGFAAMTGLPAHSRFAKDLTVGLRWDITPSLMLRAEYHNVNGTGWLSALENPGLHNRAFMGDVSQHWDLFSILFSFRF